MALSDEAQLKVSRLSMAFGGVQALWEVSFEVKKRDIFSIIGPNGAGKTVLLNCINGLYRPQEGQIIFEGKEITKLRPYQRAKLGISRTFQKIELFKGATVLDNIRLGRHNHLKTGLLSGALYLGKTAREEIEDRNFIEREIIDLLEIEHIRNKVVGCFPTACRSASNWQGPWRSTQDHPPGRALAGLNLEEVEDMARFILDINEEERWQTTCVLVEHDMGVVMDISHRVIALNFGEKIADGTPAEVQGNPK